MLINGLDLHFLRIDQRNLGGKLSPEDVLVDQGHNQSGQRWCHEVDLISWKERLSIHCLRIKLILELTHKPL